MSRNKFALAFIFSSIFTPLLAQGFTEEEFCYDGDFRLTNGSAEGDLFDLYLDVDNYAGELTQAVTGQGGDEITVISHIRLRNIDPQGIRGRVGQLYGCQYFPSLNDFSALVETDTAVWFELSPLTLENSDEWRSILRMLNKNTDGHASKGLFRLEGQVLRFADTLGGYISVRNIEFIESLAGL